MPSHKVLDPRVARLVGLWWIIAPLWYVVSEAVTASAFPSYSYATNYISDLGVPEFGVLQDRTLDSPLHAVMNAGFIGAGLMFLLGLLSLVAMMGLGRAQVVLLALGVTYSVGICLVGLVPGSPTNVQNGLIAWHGLGAILAIGAGNLAAIASWFAIPILGVRRTLGPVLGAVGSVSAALLVAHVVLPDGVWERGAVYTVMAWQIIQGSALASGAVRSEGSEQDRASLPGSTS